jgi:hypothetical protein
VFVSTLEQNQAVCDSPVIPSSAFGAIRVWIWPTDAPGPALQVTVRDLRTRRVVAEGRTPKGYAETNPPTGYPSPIGLTSMLSSTVPATRAIVICIRSAGADPVTLMGSVPAIGSGVVRSGGTPSKTALAMLFLRPHPQSLLSLLPTVFARAALFRMGWVGAWTFWALTGALLAAFGLGVTAVVLASRSDLRSERSITE